MKPNADDIDLAVIEYHTCRSMGMGERGVVEQIYMLGYWRGRERNTLPLIGIALFVGLIGGFLLSGNL